MRESWDFGGGLEAARASGVLEGCAAAEARIGSSGRRGSKLVAAGCRDDAVGEMRSLLGKGHKAVRDGFRSLGEAARFAAEPLASLDALTAIALDAPLHTGRRSALLVLGRAYVLNDAKARARRLALDVMHRHLLPEDGDGIVMQVAQLAAWSGALGEFLALATKRVILEPETALHLAEMGHAKHPRAAEVLVRRGEKAPGWLYGGVLMLFGQRAEGVRRVRKAWAQDQGQAGMLGHIVAAADAADVLAEDVARLSVKQRDEFHGGVVSGHLGAKRYRAAAEAARKVDDRWLRAHLLVEVAREMGEGGRIRRAMRLVREALPGARPPQGRAVARLGRAWNRWALGLAGAAVARRHDQSYAEALEELLRLHGKRSVPKPGVDKEVDEAWAAALR